MVTASLQSPSLFHSHFHQFIYNLTWVTITLASASQLTHTAANLIFLEGNSDDSSSFKNLQCLPIIYGIKDIPCHTSLSTTGPDSQFSTCLPCATNLITFCSYNKEQILYLFIFCLINFLILYSPSSMCFSRKFSYCNPTLPSKTILSITHL